MFLLDKKTALYELLLVMFLSCTLSLLHTGRRKTFLAIIVVVDGRRKLRMLKSDFSSADVNHFSEFMIPSYNSVVCHVY